MNKAKLKKMSIALHDGRDEQLDLFRRLSDSLHSTEGERLHAAAKLHGWDAAINVVNDFLNAEGVWDKAPAEAKAVKRCEDFTDCQHPCLKCNIVDCLCCGGDGRYKRCAQDCNSFGKILDK